MLTERVAAYVAREQLFSPDQKVVVGVSGGADSLCLLDCLHAMQVPLLVAHLDHRLRAGSWQDARHVLGISRRLGVPAVVERAPRSLREQGISLEEAARLARYQFLVREAKAWGADVIATGHTADDQAETILMHVLRGSGVHGLRGMLPCTELGDWAVLDYAAGIRLVRPLLAVTRVETETHCRVRGLRPRVDPSNLDRSFFRNRLRHDLLPELESYNPRIREVLRRTGNVMRSQAAMLDAMVDAVSADVLGADLPDAVRIHRAAFLAQPAPVQAGLLDRAARRLAPDLRDFGFEAVERARGRILSGLRGRRLALPNGLEMVDLGEDVWLVRLGDSPTPPELPQLGDRESRALAVPGSVSLGNRWSLTAREVAVPVGEPAVTGEGSRARRITVDADRLEGPLIVRAPEPGDRMQPLGMTGRRKLGEIFNTMKVPAPARARWPVVWSGGAVVWLVGLRMSHAFRLTSSTQRAVALTLQDGRSDADDP